VIGLTLCADPFDAWRSREVTQQPFRPGATVADYLPAECHDPEAHPVLAVCHNARVLPAEAWAAAELRDGDHISVMIRPGVETVILLVVTAIVTAWQIYDASRRGKIRAHHAARRAHAAAQQMGDSPTYGWGGITNVVQPGGPIQVLYGGPQRLGGQYIKAWPIHGNLDMILGISEGEVEGLVAGTVEINGKPEAMYSSASFAHQVGTNAQAGLGIFAGPSLMYVGVGFTAGGLSNPSGPANGGWYWGPGSSSQWTGTLNGIMDDSGSKPTKPTVLAVDGYEINLFQSRGTAPINPPLAVVSPAVNCTIVWQFDVRERTLPSGSFAAIRTFRTQPMTYINGVTTGKSFALKVSGLAVSRYEVEITLNVGASTVVAAPPGTTIDDTARSGVLWIARSLGEFLDFDRVHPGLATLGVEGLPAATTGGLLPTVTSVWEGRKIRDIIDPAAPATFTAEAYADTAGGRPRGWVQGQNPALVILDIMTNDRYGAGEYIDEDLDLDLASFVEARNFCDELVSRGLDAINPLQRGYAKMLFDALTDVNSGTEEITVTAHGFVDGDKVTYNDEGGTTIVGLTDLATYYVNVTGVNTVTLHATRQAALAGTGITNITAGVSENHSLLEANNGGISVSNQFALPAGSTVDFTDGSVKVDDTLKLLDGLNIDSYRVATIIDAQTMRITETAPPFADVVLTTESAVSWEIENTERRCLVAMYFDGVTTLWDAVESIAKPARLAVVRSNGKIALLSDDGGPGNSSTTVIPVQVFGMGNLENFKVERMGGIVANRVEVQFLDEQKNWEQAITAFEDDEISSSTKTLRIVRTQTEAFGVTRRSQATRIAKYHWVSNRLERELVEFETDAVALPLQWGDVIQVLHDAYPIYGLEADATGELQTRAVSGRIRDVQGNVVILDDWYTWQAGYDRFNVQRSDTDALEFLGIVPVTGDKVDRLTLGPFGGYTPVPGDVFTTVGSFVDDAGPSWYRVTDITRTEDHRRRVQAVTFDPRMFFEDATTPELFVDRIALSEIEG